MGLKPRARVAKQRHTTLAQSQQLAREQTHVAGEALTRLLEAYHRKMVQPTQRLVSLLAAGAVITLIARSPMLETLALPLTVLAWLVVAWAVLQIPGKVADALQSLSILRARRRQQKAQEVAGE